MKRLGLRKTWGSPNGACERVEWDYNFERYDHIDGIELGYKGQVLFERHAVVRSALLNGKMLGEDVEDNVRTEGRSDAGKEIVVDERV